MVSERSVCWRPPGGALPTGSQNPGDPCTSGSGSQLFSIMGIPEAPSPRLCTQIMWHTSKPDVSVLSLQTELHGDLRNGWTQAVHIIYYSQSCVCVCLCGPVPVFSGVLALVTVRDTHSPLVFCGEVNSQCAHDTTAGIHVLCLGF